jgi:hypothetical protein
MLLRSLLISFNNISSFKFRPQGLFLGLDKRRKHGKNLIIGKNKKNKKIKK